MTKELQLFARARIHGDAVAILDRETARSYNELLERSGEVAVTNCRLWRLKQRALIIRPFARPL
ncbi:MAG: hypothetical protein ACKVHE_08725 [Planctomycetales bacterium]